MVGKLSLDDTVVITVLRKRILQLPSCEKEIFPAWSTCSDVHKQRTEKMFSPSTALRGQEKGPYPRVRGKDRELTEIGGRDPLRHRRSRASPL